MTAKQFNESSTEFPEEVNTSQPKKLFFSTSLLVLLILFVIALAEVLAAYLLLPSPSAVRTAVEETMNNDVKIKPPYKPTIDENMQDEEREEVDLGEFTIIVDDAATAPFRMSIHFYGLVNKKDRVEYDKRYDIHKNRIREAILVIVRSSPQSEITEPSLGLVKNKITVKVNEILGMPLVKGLVYTDFAIQAGG